MASHDNGTLPAKQETERQSRAVSLEKVPFWHFFDKQNGTQNMRAVSFV